MTNSMGQEGIDAMLTNVTDLCPDGPARAKHVAAAEQDEEEEDDEEEEEAAGKSRKRLAWFDRDREVNRAKEALEKQRQTLLNQASKLCADWVGLEKDLSQMSADAARQLDGERRIGQTRIGCLENVRKEEAELQHYLKSFQVEMPGRSNASSATAEANKQLGNAPPCQSFQQQRSFAYWDEVLAKVLACQDKDGIEEIKVECNGIKDVISELLAACRSAVSDVARGIKAIKTAQQQRAAKKAAQKQGMQAPDKLFGLTPKCASVPQKKEGELQHADVDLDHPLMLHLADAEEERVGKSGSLQQFMIAEFMEQFNNQNPSSRLDRAHKKFTPGSEAKILVAARGAQIFPPAKLADNCDTDLVAALDVTGIIVGKNTVKCTPENYSQALPFEPKICKWNFESGLYWRIR